MAGDIKLQYAASVALTVTNLHSLATSSDFTAGWTSASVSNATNEYLDVLLSGTFTKAAANTQIGNINIYVYAALNDTPTWPDLFSTGTEGTEGAATVHDTEQLQSGLTLVKSIGVDAGASEVHTFGPIGLAQFFGGMLPTHWAVFVGTNATSSGASLAASGNALYYTPVNAQYT